MAERAAAVCVSIVEVGIEREVATALVVEIVVEHQTVHIIFADNVLAHVHHSLAHFGNTGIEHRFVVGGEQPFGVSVDIVAVALPPLG